jgi:IS1 family transposase
MNKLDPRTRAQIIQLLCEGMAIRAITRGTGASKNTIAKLLADAGRACAEYQDKALRELPCKRVQLDEIWSFVYAKQDNVRTAKSAPRDPGDAWTWTAICADTKLLISTLVGRRDTEYALHFVDDLRNRLANRVQVASDGHRPYIEAMDTVFGEDADYAMLVKHYGSDPQSERRYSPAICLGATKRQISGNPDPKHVSTSFAERQNLTMRMHMRRFTRLTSGFSKKLENHAYAVALHQMFYNFVRIHQTLKVTPAMAAKVTDRLWEMSDVIAVIDAWEADRRATGIEYQIERERIGDGYLVRKIERYAEPVTVFGFASPGAAEDWILADKASRRPGRRKLSEKSNCPTTSA